MRWVTWRYLRGLGKDAGPEGLVSSVKVDFDSDEVVLGTHLVPIYFFSGKGVCATIRI